MNKLSEEISVNDLPNWSQWPARLLGVESFKTAERNLAKIHSEYSEDKWQKCLDACAIFGGKMDAHDLRRLYYDFSSVKAARRRQPWQACQRYKQRSHDVI